MQKTGVSQMQRALSLSAVIALVLLALSACGTAAHDESASLSKRPAEGPVAFGHVHGLGINPANGQLYVASHMGVFKETDAGFVRVADRWQDTMAFTVTGDDTFLASGHPDLRETEKPAHLGLIETTDAAQTWNALSLEGESDFHALEPAADRLYGYDSVNGILKVTFDQRRWRDETAELERTTQGALPRRQLLHKQTPDPYDPNRLNQKQTGAEGAPVGVPRP